MDVELLHAASRRKKRILELESWRESLDLVRKVFGVADLVAALRNVEGKRKQLERQENAYRECNLAALTEALFDSDELSRNPRIAAEFIVGRNKKWLPKVEELVVQGDVFITVGVAHLVGDEGLLALLAANGIEMKRVDRP